MPVTAKRRATHGQFITGVIAAPIKAAVGALIAIAAIIGLFFTVEDRYAHAGDLKQLGTEIQINRLSGETAILDGRRKSIEDKVFELKQKPKRKPEEEAVLGRFDSELRDVGREISEKRQLIDKLKTGK